MIDFDNLPFVPFPDQRQVAERAARHYGLGHPKGQIWSAPGTGKTKMAALVSYIIHDLLTREREQLRRKGKNRFAYAFFVPTLTLGDQLATALREDFRPEGTDVKFTFVCSDEDMGLANGGADVNVMPTTDPEVIAREVLDADDGALHIVISTYMSTPTLVAACAGRRPEDCFDFVALDEAHWTVGVRERGGRRRKKKREVCFQDAADETKIPRRFQLAMSATPDNARLKRNQQGDVFSMDNAEQYGQQIGGLTMAQAIALGRVRDYRFVPAPVRKSDLEALVSKEGSPYYGWSLEEAATAYALECVLADPRFEVNQAIAFHRVHMEDGEAKGGIAASKRMAEGLNARAVLSSGRQVRSMHIDGEMGVKERREILDDLNNPGDTSQLVKVLTNSQALTEGINIPHANAIIFDGPRGVKPTNQALGRIVRTTVDSRKATAAVAVIIDDTDPREPKIDPDSLDRWKKLLTDIKHVDARIAERIEIMDRPLPHPAEREFQNKYEKMMLDALADEIGVLMKKASDEIMASIKPISGRTYEAVSFDEPTATWRVMIADPKTGQLVVDERYEDPETAAGRYDEWVIESGYNWPLNGILADPKRVSQMAYNSKIHRGIHERIRNVGNRPYTEWVFQAYYEMSPERRAEAKDDQRESGKFRVTRKGDSLHMACKVGDALDARFGSPEMRRIPNEPVDFSIIRNRKNMDPEVPAVEVCPIRGWWATAIDQGGNTVSLGHYPTRDAAVWAATVGQNLLNAEDAEGHTPERVLQTGERVEAGIRATMPAELMVPQQTPTQRGPTL